MSLLFNLCTSAGLSEVFNLLFEGEALDPSRGHLLSYEVSRTNNLLVTAHRGGKLQGRETGSAQEGVDAGEHLDTEIVAQSFISLKNIILIISMI